MAYSSRFLDFLWRSGCSGGSVLSQRCIGRKSIGRKSKDAPSTRGQQPLARRGYPPITTMPTDSDCHFCSVDRLGDTLLEENSGFRVVADAAPQRRRILPDIPMAHVASPALVSFLWSNTLLSVTVIRAGTSSSQVPKDTCKIERRLGRARQRRGSRDARVNL